MDNQIDEEVKEQWRDEVMELQQEVSLDKSADMVGKTIEVMIEGKISIDDIKRVFSDHGNSPQCICRHANQINLEGESLETVFSFVCNLTTLEMHFAPKRPCEGFLRIRPFDLLKER